MSPENTQQARAKHSADVVIFQTIKRGGNKTAQKIGAAVARIFVEEGQSACRAIQFGNLAVASFMQSGNAQDLM